MRIAPSLIKKKKPLSHHSVENHLRAHKYISNGEKLACWGRFSQHHKFSHLEMFSRGLNWIFSKETIRRISLIVITVGNSAKIGKHNKQLYTGTPPHSGSPGLGPHSGPVALPEPTPWPEPCCLTAHQSLQGLWNNCLPPAWTWRQDQNIIKK